MAQAEPGIDCCAASTISKAAWPGCADGLCMKKMPGCCTGAQATDISAASGLGDRANAGIEGALPTSLCAQSGAETIDSELNALCSAATATSSGSSARSARSARSTSSSPAPGGPSWAGRLATDAAVPSDPAGPKGGESSGGPGGSEGGGPSGEDCGSSPDHLSSPPPTSAAAATATARLFSSAWRLCSITWLGLGLGLGLEKSNTVSPCARGQPAQQSVKRSPSLAEVATRCSTRHLATLFDEGATL